VKARAGGTVRNSLLDFARAVAIGDAAAAPRLLASSPALATARLEAGATRQTATAYYLDGLRITSMPATPRCMSPPRPTNMTSPES